MKRITGFAVLIMTAGLFFSCTDGVYEGPGGGGNLVIVDRSGSNELKNKFIEVDGSKTVVLPSSGTLKVGFDPSSKRKKFSGKKLSAPLYNTDTNERYTGGIIPLGEEFTGFTVKVYDSLDSTNTMTNKGSQTFSVTFYKGSGLIEWK